MTTPYEEVRRKNIEENDKRLKAFNVHSLSQSLRESCSTTSKPSSHLKKGRRFVRPGDLEKANKKRLRSFSLPHAPPHVTTPPTPPRQLPILPAPPTRVTTPPATHQEASPPRFLEDDFSEDDVVEDDVSEDDVVDDDVSEDDDVEDVPLPKKKKAGYWDVDVIDEAGHISSTRLTVTDMFQNTSDTRRVITTWNHIHQPVGEAAGLLAGFLGEIARKFVEFPIIFENWKGISCDKKNEFYDQKIKTKFVVDDGENKKYILKSIATKWRNAKSRLFKKYYKWDLTLEENLRNYPRCIDRDNWAAFVQYRRKPKTLEMARKNAANRAKLKLNHSLGTKSIARTQQELEKRDGRKYSRGEMFAVSHKKSDGSFVNDEAKKKNDQLQAEIAKTHSENEAFVNVFGKEHGGFARSIGLGVTPSQLTTTCSARLTSSSEDNEKMKKMQAEIDSLTEKASQVDILKEQVAFLMQMHNSKDNQVTK
ncbi:unnamed protein product [Trifolium pratense]|uniref:Uncharacterized protein n=1 Tax=Trifolium pratense TaxID=57577 RepID=A0ACB0JBM0_TRIPR|nr:unnamed protein product [Trifolium pratense]